MLPDATRKPLRATLMGNEGDHCQKRLAQPPCSSCGHVSTRVMLRTECVLYFRCDRCRALWSLPRHTHVAFGT
jgi:hypothetical protein